EWTVRERQVPRLRATFDGLDRDRHVLGAQITQRRLEAVQLAPLVAQVGRDPQRSGQAQQEHAAYAVGDDVGVLLRRVAGAAYTDPPEDQGDGAGDGAGPGTRPVPLQPQPLCDVHQDSFVPMATW